MTFVNLFVHSLKFAIFMVKENSAVLHVKRSLKSNVVRAFAREEYIVGEIQ